MTNAEIRAALDRVKSWAGGRGTGANPQRPPGEQWKDDPYEYRAKQLWEARHGIDANRADAEWDAITSGAIADEVKIGIDANLTPQQRLAAARAADEPSVPEWAKAMFDAQAGMILEQAERIDELENSIREQGEEMASLKVHLGQQVAQMYKDAQDAGKARHKHAVDLIYQRLAVHGKLHVGLTNAAQRFSNLDAAVARIIGMLPSAGEQTGEGPWDWAARADAEQAQARERAAKQLKEEDNRD